MKLSIGIVGLPNVGKSTLFKLLTKKEVNIANYPFATIDPNVGIVEVKDERLNILAQLSHSLKIVPAVVEFYDIAGLVRGAYKGEGLGNQFLSHIRNVEVILHIVRCFKGDEIVHIEGDVNPLRDLETVELELIFKDLETVEKRLKKLEGEARSGDKKAKLNLEVLQKAKKLLEEGKLLTSLKDEEIIKELQLLSAKPQIILLNGNKEDVEDDIIKKIQEMGFDYFIANLRSQEDLSEVIKLAYKKLGLISFFTTGEDETRAWTIKEGTKAKEAAGVIHTDFEKNFIRAEVIFWEKLVEAGGWNEAKQKGWIRTEGKDYIVKDGDVLVIRHNA
jgi:ribosome-binding ATPase YchF (GTP1/OBG family)